MRAGGERSKMDLSGSSEREELVVPMPDTDPTPSGKRTLVQAVATVALATCALLPADGFASAAVPPHAPTAAGAASVPAGSPSRAQTPYDRIAVQTLDAVARGDFTAATAHFDPTLRKLLTPQALAAAWESYQSTFGSYRSHGDPEDVARGGSTVVNVPLRMERRAGEFRLSFHKDGSIAGLWFLKTGVPVP
ncbi:DUF3887 domain-containing protein [Streptomyces sp. NPDC006326]|uniref:DUF3887 domain-containing protein n=1 Tax=Streptomyces sp. NPDC006326 TaxID=3156752 RepID=UPI0033B4D1C4